MEKKVTSRVVKGVIITGIMIGLDIVLQNMYYPVPEGTRYLPRLIIVLAGIFISCIMYSRQLGGSPGFGDVFSHGLRTTALVAFMMAVYTFIAIKYIYPPPGPEEMAAAVKAIEMQGNVLHEQAVRDAAEAAKNRWIFYVSISIFATVIPGLAGSLAGAAIMKRSVPGTINIKE